MTHSHKDRLVEKIDLETQFLPKGLLARIFFKLGALGFGGPLAVVEELRRIFVQERQLLSNQEFNQVFTLLKAMPGPIAFQYSVYFGQRFGGFGGAVIAALGTLIPAAALVVGFSIFYTSLSGAVQFKHFMTSMQYAVAGVILFTVINLAKPSIKKPAFIIFSIFSGYIYATGFIPEVLIILLVGACFVLAQKIKNKNLSVVAFALPVTTELGVSASSQLNWEVLAQMAKVFFLAGALVFGTGLAAFPYFKAELVDQLGLLSLQTFNDGVSIGQVTPGPVTIVSVFYGHQIQSWAGALIALLAMYCMPFIHMSTWFPKMIKKVSKSKWIQSFSEGATAAVVGCLAVTVYGMNRSEFSSVPFWLTTIIVLGVLLTTNKISIFKLIFAFTLVNYLYLSHSDRF